MNRSRVAHNTLLNFVGLAVPLALAFFVIPVATRYLGSARFGLLTLAWAITEYLTFFDLGLGRALVKFVADALHVESTKLSEIVSLSMAVQLAAGILGGALLALAAPLLVEKVFRVTPSLASEAVAALRVVGLSLPIGLLMSGQRAVLEGAQRFDLSSMLKMLGTMSGLIIPAIGAVARLDVPSILLWVLAARLLVCVLYAWAIHRALPTVRLVRSRDSILFKRIGSFGGWVLVSNTISPLLVYFDRFALTAIAGLAAVGLYTAPYEGIVRLLIIPASLAFTLLPALTAIEASGDREAFARVASSSVRVLTVAMALPLTVVAVFASDILRLWLGPQFASASATAMRWLALGVFANSIANPLLAALYARNRPDIPAKFHILELIVHVPLTIFLIRLLGIRGAAIAWAARVTLDMVLLTVADARVSGVAIVDALGGRLAQSIGLIALLVLGLEIARILVAVSLVAAALVAVASALVFALASWTWILSTFERDALLRTALSYTNIVSRSPATSNQIR